MANPTYDQGSIKKRKAPGVAIVEKDSSSLAEVIGIHNDTPPALVDGDVKQIQLDDLANMKMTLGDPAQIIELKTQYIFPVPMGWKRQIDFGGRTDGQPVYMGFALTSTGDGDAEWYMFKFTYTDNFNTLVESEYGEWDERGSAF